MLGELALPIGGVMSRLSVEEVEEQLQALKVLTRQLGISSDIDAFMTLAFVSLPVIPKLRINTYGVIDGGPAEAGSAFLLKKIFLLLSGGFICLTVPPA